MSAWRGKSALYLAPEPYELLCLSFERSSEYPLYFCAVWPFGMHGVTFRHREEWASLGLWLRQWFGRRRHWGRFRRPLGSFGPVGRDACPLRRRPPSGRACSGAALGAGFGALRLWKLLKMLYAGPWPSLGRCIPRSLLACSCRLVVQCFRVCFVSVGQEIQRSACNVLCLRM